MDILKCTPKDEHNLNIYVTGSAAGGTKQVVATGKKCGA
jgi:hypothetical protein